MSKEKTADMVTKISSDVDSPMEFEARINSLPNKGWLEIPEKFMEQTQLMGLHGGGDYFIYKNRFVCRKGDTKRIQDLMSQQHGQIVHGPKEGIKEGVT